MLRDWRLLRGRAGRLSPPQHRSLEILDRIMEIAQPQKGADSVTALDVIRSMFASVTDFEREFPSLCFALSTTTSATLAHLFLHR